MVEKCPWQTSVLVEKGLGRHMSEVDQCLVDMCLVEKGLVDKSPGTIRMSVIYYHTYTIDKSQDAQCVYHV